MSRFEAILIVLILFSGCYAGAAQSTSGQTGAEAVTSGPAWDWLGVWPVYSYNGLLSPYYPYYYPTYGPLRMSQPVYYYPTYLIQRYPASPWWIGEHWELGKTMQIARTGSSIRVYSQGAWQTV